MNAERREFVEKILSRSKLPDIYKSPLEAAVSVGGAILASDGFTYFGTVGSVLEDLQRDVAIYRRPSSLVAYHTSRLISGIIDWKTDQPSSKALSLLRQSVAASLALRAFSGQAVEQFSSLEERLRDLPQILDISVVQNDDISTRLASTPDKSYSTAQAIALYARENPILFLPLAHGAVSAGMDVFLRFKDLTEDQESEFFPVRFSRYKKNDEVPQLSRDEIELLTKSAEGKTIVVFEEDTKTYKTADAAYNFFSEMFVDNRVAVAVNKREFSSKKRPYVI